MEQRRTGRAPSTARSCSSSTERSGTGAAIRRPMLLSCNRLCVATVILFLGCGNESPNPSTEHAKTHVPPHLIHPTGTPVSVAPIVGQPLRPAKPAISATDTTDPATGDSVAADGGIPTDSGTPSHV